MYRNNYTELRSRNYWYDDNNEVRVPKTWNIEYLDESNKWQKYPLYLTVYSFLSSKRVSASPRCS